MHTKKLLVLVFALIVAGISFVLYQSGYFSSTNDEDKHDAVILETVEISVEEFITMTATSSEHAEELRKIFTVPN